MSSILSNIVRGYGRLLNRLLMFISAILLVTGFSILITLPLWIAATRIPKIYTAGILGASGTAILAGVISRFRRKRRNPAKMHLSSGRAVLRPVLRCAVLVLLLVGVVLLFLANEIVIGIIAAAAYFAIYGLLVYGARK